MKKRPMGLDPAAARNLPMTEPEFPTLTALDAMDRQAHIERGIEAGLTREQAEKHAEEHIKDRVDESD